MANGIFKLINVKIKGGDVTEVNAQGPEISDADVAKLFEKQGKIYKSTGNI